MASLNLHTDQNVSTVTIKNGSIFTLINYVFWSPSLLSQLELFKGVVFGKVCFNLIKLRLFCFIYFFFLLLFFYSFRFFVSFVFTGVGRIPPKENCPSPVRVTCIKILQIYISRSRTSYFGESHDPVNRIIGKKVLHRCLLGILNLKIA